MKTIEPSKIDLHLKLGRQLAQFVKIDQYFDDQTFDWIKLEKAGELYRATLIRSLDQGDEIFCEVLEFDTVNDLDESENIFMEGNKEEVFSWMVDEYAVKLDGFYELAGLKEKYRAWISGEE